MVSLPSADRHCARYPLLRWCSLAIAIAISLPDSSARSDDGGTRSEAATSNTVTALTPHLSVYHGPIHVGIVHEQGRSLVIDCGDGSVAAVLSDLGVAEVDQLAFTHYHRDQSSGIRQFDASVPRAVPSSERPLFEQPQDYWQDDQWLYRVYRSFRPDHLLPVDPVRVDRVYGGGDVFSFGPATVSVLDTPGHTDGSVSYLVEVDGKRILFCGDLMAGDGQIWDLFSLQQGFARGGQSVGGYHGFLGDRWRLAASLQAVAESNPDVIVPSHGQLIERPQEAVRHLMQRLEDSYENYVSISALRHYFPQLFTEYEGRSGQMPMRPGTAPPERLRHVGTSWILLSKTGAALVMDVGSPQVVERLQAMMRDQEIAEVEGLWVTHYHHDHTDGILQFQREFDCPCFTDAKLADVLTRPAAWRLPCLIPDPIRIDRSLPDGHSWQWHEYRLTSYFYPGQTLYHAALLVEVDDLRMMFVGDSHTPGGLDDYCAYNRNLLGSGVGFQYCLALLQQLQPTHLFNCHVADAFHFTTEEIEQMQHQLTARETMFGELTPWPHANFGTDPSWVRVDPYRQSVRTGGSCQATVVLTNHAAESGRFQCRIALPQAWGGGRSEWRELSIAARNEGVVVFDLEVPASSLPGRHVITFDVRMNDRELPVFSECIVDVVEDSEFRE